MRILKPKTKISGPSSLCLQRDRLGKAWFAKYFEPLSPLPDVGLSLDSHRCCPQHSLGSTALLSAACLGLLLSLHKGPCWVCSSLLLLWPDILPEWAQQHNSVKCKGQGPESTGTSQIAPSHQGHLVMHLMHLLPVLCISSACALFYECFTAWVLWTAFLSYNLDALALQIRIPLTTGRRV